MTGLDSTANFELDSKFCPPPLPAENSVWASGSLPWIDPLPRHSLDLCKRPF